ncbi:MAG: hypothetical protein AB8I08_19725 [Sandaracinaceae bacterium]
MTRPTEERGVEALRRRAERALDEGRSRKVVEPLLERLLRTAPAGDPASLFAHRHLAELRLEVDPWSAALHLKKVVAANPDDDVAHSLMALAHALLGNYRSAVRSYRHALRVSPVNPWYHHNLGHLLDVALDTPRDALPHLEQALAHARPPEHEITASAAHCLARVGRLEEAGLLAAQALVEAPNNLEHLALLAWIDEGAPADRPVHPVASSMTSESSGDTGRTEPSPDTGDADEVARLFETHMVAAGMNDEHVALARALWADYQGAVKLRIKKPRVYAATCHYAVTQLRTEHRATQREIAELYGVHRQTLGSRYRSFCLHIDLSGR